MASRKPFSPSTTAMRMSFHAPVPELSLWMWEREEVK